VDVVRVIVKTYGSVNKDAGWNSFELRIREEKVSLEKVLKLAVLKDQRSMFDLIASEKGLKENYAMFLRGQLLWQPVDLQMQIDSGDELLILDFPFTLGGG
jgi:hypothetical protein